MNTRELTVYDNKTVLIRRVAEDFLRLVDKELRNRDILHIVLTGGSVGIGVLEAAGGLLDRFDIDWYRVHFWWGDERWLPHDDPERNHVQASRAFLDGLGLPDENIHHFASSDDGISLEAAVTAMNEELAEFASSSELYPEFVLTFLGVGPDGHIASLFPNLPGVEETEFGTIAVTDSPKPPSERLSFSLPLLNTAHKIWLVLAGADKTEALHAALNADGEDHLPVSLIQARENTRIFTDRDAAGSIGTLD